MNEDLVVEAVHDGLDLGGGVAELEYRVVGGQDRADRFRRRGAFLWGAVFVFIVRLFTLEENIVVILDLTKRFDYVVQRYN